MQHENGAFRFGAEENGERRVWRPYDGLPAVTACSNGRYLSQPDWYRNFLYREEEMRGLDATEDLASPGVFEFSLSAKTGGPDARRERRDQRSHPIRLPRDMPTSGRASAAAGRNFLTPLHRAADAYLGMTRCRQDHHRRLSLVRRLGPRHLHRDPRSLHCDRPARRVRATSSSQWAGVVSEGMLPNRFPDRGDQPEFNSVDASLWYIVAVGDYLRAVEHKPQVTGDRHAEQLRNAVEAILDRLS